MSASSRRWSRAHAERLLWRAGFGARPKEIEFWAQRSRERTIDWLIRGGAGPHGTRRMVGPAPRANGKPLDPVNEWGHDMLWWLDKMVRSQRPLQEKLTLFWHDHFATSQVKVKNGDLMQRQNRQLRSHAVGQVPRAARRGGQRPSDADLARLEGEPQGPPERELRPRGHGAVHPRPGEVHRSATSSRPLGRSPASRATGTGAGRSTVSYYAERHDDGAKRLLGHRGRLDWQDVLSLVVGHRSHAPFLVGKLWDFFVTEPLPAATRKRLARVYVRSHHRIAPVVREILGSRAWTTPTTRRWSSGRSCSWRATCAWSAARSTPTTGRGSAR